MASVPATAVFGAGRIGRVHARNLAVEHGAAFAGVADVDEDAAARLVAELGCGRAGSVESFLQDPDVTAVVIATPTGTHADLIERCASARKHIFCEKPISLDVDETNRAIAAVRRAGVTMQIGFQRRFDPKFVRARRAVESNELGPVRFIRLVGRDRALPPIEYIRTSGGQYKDQMIHDFDAARWLAGEEVEEVVAVGSALADRRVADAGDVDTAVACLRFASGALAVIDASREAPYGYDARLEIQGSRGLFLDDDRLRSGTVMDASFLTPDADSFADRFGEAYKVELHEFLAALERGSAPKARGEDALQALRIAIAADRSRRERRTVQLAEIEGA